MTFEQLVRAKTGLHLEAAMPTQPAPKPVPIELRGIWIASVTNIDWPSRTGLTPAQQQAELVDYYDLAMAHGFNTVAVQVRPTADTFWPSPLEPWSKYLTGTQGKDPGYDPLAFAVAEAHRRNLDFHAWFNPFRITMNLADVAGLTSTHPAKSRPEWTVAYGGRLYYNPGVPEARKFCQAVILDAITKYDIDAVHFDDYFYPYPVAGEVFHDEAQYAQYGAGRSLADWRRDNINALITELGSAIKTAKPWVKFGVSPFGVWMNQTNDARGSATQAGVQTYADLCADTLWVPRTVSPPLISTFPQADLNITVPCQPSRIARCDLSTRLPGARSRAELAGAARPLSVGSAQAAKAEMPSACLPDGVRAAATRWPTRPSVAAAIRPARTRWWAAGWSQQQRPPRNRSGSVPSASSAPPAATARRIARSRPLKVLVAVMAVSEGARRELGSVMRPAVFVPAATR
jgi:glycosyl hydrolase family 10